MARILVAEAAEDFLFLPNALENDGAIDILEFSSTSLKFESNSGFIVTLTGSGFAQSGGVVGGGKISSLIVRDATNTITLFSVTGLKADLQTVYYRLFGWSTDDGDKGPDAVGAFRVMFAGRDIFNGSSGSDELGGYSDRNDKINGRGGDDNINGDEGHDKLNGGTGWDQLDYRETFFGSPAPKGIKLDASKGVVVDPWGFIDRIKAFEEYRGSANADTMKGSGKDENFNGLGGNDKIDGKGGWDEVYYSDDDRFGGSRGVTVDLAAGTATDGWGSSDRLKNIEGVGGTRHDDVLKGSDKDNILKGEDGNDTMTGGGGGDMFVFNQAPDSTTNHDVITDFDPAAGDRIALSKPDAFPELASNENLAATEFVANATGTPTTEAHRVLYNTATGDLFFDPTGTAVAGDAVLIATLTGAPTITHEAFEIWT